MAETLSPFFMKRLLDYDPFSKVSTFHEYDSLTDKSTISYAGDVETNLEWSKGLQKDESYSKKGMKKEMWHYAHIPNVTLLKWQIEKGLDINDTKALLREVNKPENAYLKATTKKHA